MAHEFFSTLLPPRIYGVDFCVWGTRIRDFYLDSEEELSVFTYSEILENRLQGHVLSRWFNYVKIWCSLLLLAQSVKQWLWNCAVLDRCLEWLLTLLELL